MSNLYLDAQFIKAELGKLIASHPELEADEELRLDTIEGETDALRFISRLVRRRRESIALASAGKEIRSEQSERVARFEKQAEAFGYLIKSVMLAADLPKLVLPEATVSITKPRTSVKIIDANELPQGFYAVERKPKSAEIKAELEAGREVPGAELVLGDEVLFVRSK